MSKVMIDMGCVYTSSDVEIFTREAYAEGFQQGFQQAYKEAGDKVEAFFAEVRSKFKDDHEAI